MKANTKYSRLLFLIIVCLVNSMKPTETVVFDDGSTQVLTKKQSESGVIKDVISYAHEAKEHIPLHGKPEILKSALLLVDNPSLQSLTDKKNPQEIIDILMALDYLGSQKALIRCILELPLILSTVSALKYLQLHQLSMSPTLEYLIYTVLTNPSLNNRFFPFVVHERLGGDPFQTIKQLNVENFIWSPDNKTLVTLSYLPLADEEEAEEYLTVYTFDETLNKFKELQKISLSHGASNLSWSYDGRFLALSGANSVYIYEKTTEGFNESSKKTLHVDGMNITAAAWAPQGYLLATRSHTGMIMLWGLRDNNGELIFVKEAELQAYNQKPNPNVIIMENDLPENQIQEELLHERWSNIAWNASGSSIAITTLWNKCHIIAVKQINDKNKGTTALTLVPVQVLEKPSLKAYFSGYPVFSADGNNLLLPSFSDICLMYGFTNNQWVLKNIINTEGPFIKFSKWGISHEITTVSWNHFSNMFSTARSNSWLTLWSYYNRQWQKWPVIRLKKEDEVFHGWSPDGNYFALATGSDGCRIWKTPQLRDLGTGHNVLLMHILYHSYVMSLLGAANDSAESFDFTAASSQEIKRVYNEKTKTRTPSLQDALNIAEHDKMLKSWLTQTLNSLEQDAKGTEWELILVELMTPEQSPFQGLARKQ